MEKEKTLNEIKEDIKTDNVKGLVHLENYAKEQLNLGGYKMVKVLDDILMCQYIDETDTKEVKRDGIYIPLNILERGCVWRFAKVLLAGPSSTIKPGECIVFPNDKGIPVARMGSLKNLVFLNEARVFGVIEPE